MPTNTQIKTNISTTWNTNGVSYSTIPLVSGISHKDQLEIERPFITPSTVILKQEDLRTIYVIPSSNFTVNETTKTITGITAPTTYTQTSTNTVIQIPAIAPNDKLIIRRKSISNESLVNWVDGTRLTATQLNLQTTQLLNLTQEILDRLKYEYVTSTDIDYNTTYNTASKTFVEGLIGPITTATVKAYVDLVSTKVGSGSIQAPNNSDIVTKLNAIDTTVTSALSGTGSIFSGFPLGAVVIAGTNGAKDYSNNFTLTKGSPDLLTLTGNLTVNGGVINLIGQTSIRGSSTNNILSIKNSSGVEVNTIDQYGNINLPVASTTQPPNPVIGSLHFSTNGNNLLIYTSSGWTGLGAFNQPSGVDLTTAQNITGSKTFSGNTGFGINANPLTIIDINGPSGVTSFNTSSVLGTTIRGSTGTTDYSGIDFTGGTTGTGPKARIAALFGSSGSKLQLGTATATTNTYSGITNSGITIDSDGKVGITNTTSPSFNLDVTGTGRFTSTVNLEANTTLNNNVNIMFKDSGGTARNSFTLDSSNVYKLGDISNAITDSDLELYAKRNFEFISNATEIARFTSTGRLGIGTNNPSTSIHVVTAATANTITQGDGTGTLSIGLNGSGAGSIVHTTSGVNNQLTLNATNGILFANNVQIANTKKISVGLIDGLAGNLQLQDSTSTNRVGIGVAAPTEKLEVDGNIKIISSNVQVTPKLISPVVETGIIQSTGTIEFRQAYNAAGGTTPDMTIDPTGTVVFAQAPKIGSNPILVPSAPVVCGTSTSGSTFRYNKSWLKNYIVPGESTANFPLTYTKIGNIVYVYGIMGTDRTTVEGDDNAIDSFGSTNSSNAPIIGLPGAALPRFHFLSQGYFCVSNAGVKYPNSRASRLITGYVTSDGFLRLKPFNHGGGDATNSTTHYMTFEFNGLGTIPSGNGSGTFSDVDRPNGASFFYTSPSLKAHFLKSTVTNGYLPNSQYIIFNFSYIAAS